MNLRDCVLNLPVFLSAAHRLDAFVFVGTPKRCRSKEVLHPRKSRLGRGRNTPQLQEVDKNRQHRASAFRSLSGRQGFRVEARRSYNYAGMGKRRRVACPPDVGMVCG